MLNNLNSERMNIIQKIDDWYKQWRGVSHLDDSNLQVLDSSDAQDFARYCIDEYKRLVSGAEQGDSNYNIPKRMQNGILQQLCECDSGVEVCACGRQMVREAENAWRCVCGRTRWNAQT